MAVSELETARSGGLVPRLLAGSDRLLPLLGFLLFLLLPAVSFPPESFGDWHDQELYLDALRSVLAHGRADVIDDDIVGPAYIALAALVHGVSGLSPEASLVWLSKIAHALGAAGSLLLVRALVVRLVAPPAVVTLTAQLSALALLFGSWTWRWSEFPWTHHVALAAAVAFFALRFRLARRSLPAAAALGAVLAILFLTRTFEFVAVVLAWGIGLGLAALLRSLERPLLRPLHVGAGAAAFVLVVTAVYATTGKRDVFVLYGSNLGRQAAAVRPAEVAETPTLSLGLVPTKLVQLFVDPCYLSDCRLDDYTGRPTGLGALWRMPLLVQLPALAFLPLVALLTLVLVVGALRRREVEAPHGRAVRQLVELTVVAGGIVLGYTASTLTGPSHLKYGFAREYLLPSFLTGVVVVGLGLAALWLVLAWVGRRRLVRELAFVLLATGATAGLLGGISAARDHGLPRIDSRHLGSIRYTATCGAGACAIAVDARSPSGRRVSIPQASVLTFGCRGERDRFSIYARSPAQGVLLPRSCRDPSLVAAWPTVMGLAPDSAHLGYVAVSTLRTGG